MKLISFRHQGHHSYGVVLGDEVRDLGALLGAEAPDLKTLIAKNLFAAAAEAARTHRPALRFDALELLPVIPNPGQIFCIGLNYGEHVRETGKEITETPVIFLRLPESQVGHRQDIVRPPESHRLDYEAEIAVIIGQGGRRIREEDAWKHIAGYACYNDRPSARGSSRATKCPTHRPCGCGWRSTAAASRTAAPPPWSSEWRTSCPTSASS